jgi:acetyl esterase/lipase
VASASRATQRRFFRYWRYRPYPWRLDKACAACSSTAAGRRIPCRGFFERYVLFEMSPLAMRTVLIRLKHAFFLQPAASRLLRVTAWVALLGVAAALVRAEVGQPALPEGVDAFTDIVYLRAESGQERLDLYVPRLPAPPEGWPVVLAVHGGGWHGGSKVGYGRELASLAQHGYAVVAPTYRLSRTGQPSWPENLADLRGALRWVRRDGPQFGLDPERVVAMGASAGAQLALLLGTRAQDPSLALTESVNQPLPARVRAVVDFYGPADLPANFRASPAAATSLALFLGGTPQQVSQLYDDASPVRFVTARTPPVLLVHGLLDRVVPPDQSRAMAAALLAQDVRHRLILLADAGHGFPLRSPQRDLTPEVLDFLSNVWKDK